MTVLTSTRRRSSLSNKLACRNTCHRTHNHIHFVHRRNLYTRTLRHNTYISLHPTWMVLVKRTRDLRIATLAIERRILVLKTFSIHHTNCCKKQTTATRMQNYFSQRPSNAWRQLFPFARKTKGAGLSVELTPPLESEPVGGH